MFSYLNDVMYMQLAGSSRWITISVTMIHLGWRVREGKDRNPPPTVETQSLGVTGPFPQSRLSFTMGGIGVLAAFECCCYGEFIGGHVSLNCRRVMVTNVCVYIYVHKKLHKTYG